MEGNTEMERFIRHPTAWKGIVHKWLSLVRAARRQSYCHKIQVTGYSGKKKGRRKGLQPSGPSCSKDGQRYHLDKSLPSG